MKIPSKNLKASVLSLMLILALFIGVFSLSVTPAFAATPTLSITPSGTNNVQLTVYGDQNASVQLYYYAQGTNVITSAGIIGTTNASGYFSTTLSSNSYGISSGTTVYTIVNNQQSQNVVWPYVNGTTGGAVYLSQSNLNLSTGQNSTVTVSGGTGNYYVSSNSNSTVVSASVAANTIGIYGLAQGSATLTICSQAYSGSCAYLYVTVNGTSWNSSPISLSQSSVTLNPGQTQTVTIYINNSYYTNNSYSYYISNNPNSSIASASVAGNVVTVTGNNPGSVSFSVCSSNAGTNCTSLYVTVSSYYGYNNNNYNNGNYTNGTYYNGVYYPYGYNPSIYTYSQPTTYTYPSTYSYVQPTYTYTTPTYTQPTYVYSNQTTGRSVSGVYLSQVPNTGISFGLKMTLFVIGLSLWSIFGAYVLHKRKDSVAVGSGAASADVSKQATIADRFKMEQMKKKGLI